jgi:hypothetical protein
MAPGHPTAAMMTVTSARPAVKSKPEHCTSKSALPLLSAGRLWLVLALLLMVLLFLSW